MIRICKYAKVLLSNVAKNINSFGSECFKRSSFLSSLEIKVHFSLGVCQLFGVFCDLCYHVLDVGPHGEHASVVLGGEGDDLLTILQLARLALARTCVLLSFFVLLLLRLLDLLQSLNSHGGLVPLLLIQ